MKRFLLLIFCILMFNLGFTQNNVPHLSPENKSLLEYFKKEEISRINRVAAYKQVGFKSSPHKTEALRYSQIYDVLDGVVLYRTTHNADAAIATRTADLQLNGSLGLNLDGSGMTVGVWDFGPVDLTHPEFQFKNEYSRIENVDKTSVDKGTEYSDHATHVSGTIGAKGIDAKAKGMATNIKIKSYNWTNDKKEMVLAAADADSPILLSNHSYGVPIVGDDKEKLPAYYMGAYTKDARDIDEILRNNPKYLIVASAGNDGKVSYTGGMYSNFDKLTSDKNAKNNLVVANANPIMKLFSSEFKSLIISSSSSQGPTDDLRVKPDIAGDGSEVYSTIPNGGYDVYSGTSMAAPNVTGTLVLLQQYYKQLNGDYMNSSTLKGLVCHTALDDIAAPGPDPSFGWGFLDARGAAETIKNASLKKIILDELSLNQGGNHTISFTAQAGDKIKASICWTDMPGDFADNEPNDPTPRLVNDLDLRVSKDGETYFPWKLDYSPSSGFSNSKGDNKVDNIEIIEFNAPTSGIYNLTVSHKGRLKGNEGGPFDPQKQNFSLILTGANASLATKSNALNMGLSIFPNPNNGEFSISIESAVINDNPVLVSVYDISGRLVLRKKYENSFQSFYETINLGQALPGVYLVNIAVENMITTQKIVIK